MFEIDLCWNDLRVGIWMEFFVLNMFPLHTVLLSMWLLQFYIVKLNILKQNCQCSYYLYTTFLTEWYIFYGLNLFEFICISVVPSKPSVTIEHFDATRFYFHLVASTVKGPQVTHFKVTYKRAGSNDNFEQTVARGQFLSCSWHQLWYM